MPTGSALHWESLDADLGVAQLVPGLFGSKSWMTELGRHGGQSKSLAKRVFEKIAKKAFKAICCQ
jgi:hypothetical protein